MSGLLEHRTVFWEHAQKVLDIEYNEIFLKEKKFHFHTSPIKSALFYELVNDNDFSHWGIKQKNNPTFFEKLNYCETGQRLSFGFRVCYELPIKEAFIVQMLNLLSQIWFSENISKRR